MVDCVSGGLEFWHRNIKEGKIEPAGGLMAHVGIGGSAEASGDRQGDTNSPGAHLNQTQGEGACLSLVLCWGR